MATNYGQLPAMGSYGSFNLNRAGTTTANSFMNRAKAAMSAPMNMVIMGLGLVLLIFLLLVIYNRTVGEKVRDGWEQIKTILRNKGIIDVEIDPGNTGTPLVAAKLDPEPSVVFPPLTAALLPEPVTVPKPADNPPTDNMAIPVEDRPSGMPGSAESHSSSSVLQKVHQTVSNKNEVFNISRNVYTFNDAAAVCAAVGAELATYDQVKEAYEDGADWCNYGWIKGQMAVYPTQKKTWEKLQKGAPEFRHACGQPGVNGGYFDNPELQFGVNCYGVKPPQKASDELLDSQVTLPQSAAELEFEKDVQRFRDQMDTAAILPFQKGQWNEYKSRAKGQSY
jgi:hypothetical protein